jgi:hypothetical protein
VRAASEQSTRPATAHGDGRVAAADDLSRPSPGRVDLEALQTDPAGLEALAVDDLVVLLAHCAAAHERVATLERLIHARLARELPGLVGATEGLLTARQAAQRLGVSPDYLRDHGAALGIAVALDGMVRYDPAAIERLRDARRGRLPRD